eukprot:TRINITY_DN10764_c0_g1_i1.p1 TRINITY_DN10764_c0_g1~~TRINITY_DN10764_c0_g1_i1.p1  ORF type:complete len:432 (+),score=109.21 TRINITY_DN10764_c0_g1_i1:25-1296(+)
MESVQDLVYRALPCETVCLSYMQQLEHCNWELTLPDGTTRTIGDGSGKKVNLTVKDTAMFRKIVRKSDTGMGESFIDGDWECDEYVQMFCDIIINMRAGVSLADTNPVVKNILSGASGFVQWLYRNTPTLSHDNVKAHYDIGNDFYKLMLDDATMSYTCGVYESPSDTLEQAQLNKLHLVMNKLKLKETDRVAELGCGWGGFAMEAAKRHGCSVYAVNLSGEQIDFAKQRAIDRGLADKVSFNQHDYRATEGFECYDKVVSIGMMEHVGHYDLPTFFETADRLLKPGGILVIHMITFLDQSYDHYINDTDFIKKYIFPGCCIPSVTALLNAATSKSRFVAQHIENFGANYAKTLHDWRDNFQKNMDQVKALGYDERFCKMWDFYLTYCEAGFKMNKLGLHHMVFTRPSIDPPYPLGRLEYSCN